MKWKYKTIQELNGGSLSSNMVRVARAVNHNAYLLKEAVQKIANDIEMMNFRRFVLTCQIFIEKFGDPKHSRFVDEKQNNDLNNTTELL